MCKTQNLKRDKLDQEKERKVSGKFGVCRCAIKCYFWQFHNGFRRTKYDICGQTIRSWKRTPLTITRQHFHSLLFHFHLALLLFISAQTSPTCSSDGTAMIQLNTESGTISLTQELYQFNMKCKWTITVSPNKVCKLPVFIYFT